MLRAMSRIAFLGLGRMGAGMASAVARRGARRHRLQQHCRARRAARRCGRDDLANSPRDACADADAVVAMTADDVSSRAMWLGERRRARRELGAAGAGHRVLDVVARLGRRRWRAQRANAGCAMSTRPLRDCRRPRPQASSRCSSAPSRQDLEAARPLLDALATRCCTSAQPAPARPTSSWST